MAKPKVLYVENDPVVGYTIAKVLEARGYDTNLVPHGQEAINQIEGGLEYDVALVELLLPDVGGEDVVRASKRINPDIKYKPVICFMFKL